MAVNPGTPFYNPRPDMQTAFNQGSTPVPSASARAAKTYDEIMRLDPNADPRRVGPYAAENYMRAVYALSPHYKVNERGEIVNRQNFYQRNQWWIAPATMIGASYIPGGGGAPTGGSQAASTAPGAAANAAPTTAGALAAPTGTLPAASQTALATSSTVPTAASTALPHFLDSTSVVAPYLNPAANAAALTASVAGASAPAVTSLFGPTPSTYTPDVPQPETPANRQRVDTNSTSRSGFQLPFGLTVRDLAGLGLGAYQSYMNNRSANNQTAAQAEADKAALDFAMRSYDEQNAKEQARFEATEARRAPYRRASLDTLAEFRRLLGLGD
jgi:hypothetical protein